MKYCLSILSFLISFISHAQSSVEAGIAKGNEYYKQSEYDLAEKQYRQALKADPNNAMARYNLANALYRQKQYDEAEAILKKISDKKAADKSLRSSSYYNTGVIYSQQKDLEASIDAYKNALRLNPNDKQARENLQKALIELKQKQQQQKKDQQQNRNQRQNMSQSEAERKLQQLEEKEKQIQQKMQNQKSGNPLPQDW